MALIDDVERICDRLANAGWRDLMQKQGIDIKQSSARKLAIELNKQTEVDKSVPGFADFINDRARGIEPGNPAASLFYHALASPDVHRVPGEETSMGPLSQPITEFPTIEELDTIENYIFATAERSLDDVRQHAADLLEVNRDTIELAVAVFASEYRPASETPHQRYADLCLSRTGVARVGTSGAVYDGKLRGYVPFQDGDTVHTIRVLPCRYVTWLAARSSAKENRFGPARIQRDDDGRGFWVPVHKLFDGGESLVGEDIKIELTARHQNKKIERLHQRLEDAGVPSGFSSTDRQKSPFIKEHGLADWLGIFHGGSGLLGPLPQPLSERASFDNAYLTFDTPAMSGGGFNNGFSPTLSLDAPPVPERPWPEYAHVRYEVENGNAVYFGDRSDAEARATEGGYRALNISDSTADGSIKATVSGIGGLDSMPAYSVVAAPDFFPAVDQREVFEWWENMKDPEVLPTLPQWLRTLAEGEFWNFWERPPVPLSDTRFAPNITLRNSGFDSSDDTVTSIVAPLQRIDLSKSKLAVASTQRHAVLPDAAAGVFAPGWDASADSIGETGAPYHLSSYGLGSPFPEDAKLCAALSTFWPAAAPDTARTFLMALGTVCPLTDEENGASPGSVSWDGLRGPRALSEDGDRTIVRYPVFEHADYTLSALEGRFSIAATGKISFREYTGRILATLRMYRALQRVGDRRSLHILSFRRIESTDRDLKEAQDDTATALSGPILRFDAFHDSNVTRLGSDVVGQEDFAVDRVFTLFVGTSDFLLAMVRRGDGSRARGPWQRIDV